METHGFCVFDSAAKRYLEPFFCPSVEFAIREFKSAANTEGHMFSKYPADYTLFYIGTFDPEKGQLIGTDPTSLGVAITFIDVDSVKLEA